MNFRRLAIFYFISEGLLLLLADRAAGDVAASNFRGLWSRWPGGFIPNAITGDGNCPIGTTDYVVGNPRSDASDYALPVHLCLTARVDLQNSFGGMFFTCNSSTYSFDIVNPVTNSTSCPRGFQQLNFPMMSPVLGNRSAADFAVCKQTVCYNIVPGALIGGFFQVNWIDMTLPSVSGVNEFAGQVPGSYSVANPVTNDFNCPDGYDATWYGAARIPERSFGATKQYYCRNQATVPVACSQDDVWRDAYCPGSCTWGDTWVDVLPSCQNNIPIDQKCSITLSRGTSNTKSKTSLFNLGYTVKAQIEAEIKFLVGGSVSLQTAFTSGYQWGTEDSTTFDQATSQTISSVIPPYSCVQVQQVKATCGSITVASGKYRFVPCRSYPGTCNRTPLEILNNNCCARPTSTQLCCCQNGRCNVSDITGDRSQYHCCGLEAVLNGVACSVERCARTKVEQEQNRCGCSYDADSQICCCQDLMCTVAKSSSYRSCDLLLPAESNNRTLIIAQPQVQVMMAMNQQLTGF